ncbi:aspartate/glutamate racemase family protein [Virgibacillus oceani]
MLGIIRVLSTENLHILREHGRKMENDFQIQTVSRCIEDQPYGIYDSASEKIATPKIVKLARKMADEDAVDAITISCAADPALEEVRRAVYIPVFGAGVCGAYAASMVGSHVAVIGIAEEVPPAMKEALGNKFHSYSFSEHVRKTTDLSKLGAKVALCLKAEEAVKQGADVILFACTGFSTIHLKEYLRDKLSVPAVDLVEAQAVGYSLLRGNKAF